jgi:Domain of unknown function (DUF1905)
MATVLAMTQCFTTRATLWLWNTDKAPASWHFLTIVGEVAEGIRVAALMDRLERTGHTKARGWGSIKVIATIGETVWQTALFPAKDVGGWMLPVKAEVRRAEGLVVGDILEVTLKLA